MKRLQAFKFELRANGQQQRQLRRFTGSCRFSFNKALALQKERFERGEKKLGYAGLCKELTAWRNSLHKATTTISQNHAMVCIEDLQERNMSRSAAGTAGRPGRNVRVKRGLNKAILDQGWAEFRRQLAYKMAWSGGDLIAVPPHNTSRTCPDCGHVVADNRRTQAQFRCAACGHANHADVVGAMNSLARGHRVAACGEVVRSGPSAKHEPTEATVHEVTHA